MPSEKTKDIKVNPKQILESLKRFFRILGERAFLFYLFLLFAGIAYGGFIYYKYSVEPREYEVHIEVESLMDEKKYGEVVEEWQRREKVFQGAGNKEFTNPFWGQPKAAP